MDGLDSLLMLVGNWAGKNRLQDPASGLLDVSDSSLSVTPVLKGRFVRMDYTWSYRGYPQEGSFLHGFDKITKEASAYWIDSFHMGEKGMNLQGSVDLEGVFHFFGSDKAPYGPDWGWRTVISPASRHFRLVSYNISPTGKEDLAIESDYRKSK